MTSLLLVLLLLLLVLLLLLLLLLPLLVLQPCPRLCVPRQRVQQRQARPALLYPPLAAGRGSLCVQCRDGRQAGSMVRMSRKQTGRNSDSVNATRDVYNSERRRRRHDA